MAFRVETTETAEQNILGILDWLIAQQAGQTGLRWFEGLETAVASLAEMPQRCPVAPESKEFPFEARQLIYGHPPHVYRILFAIRGDVVHVLGIRHGRRQHLQSGVH